MRILIASLTILITSQPLHNHLSAYYLAIYFQNQDVEGAWYEVSVDITVPGDLVIARGEGTVFEDEFGLAAVGAHDLEGHRTGFF